jgi:hypothetical protein
MKAITVLILIAGESLCIYAEMIAANRHALGDHSSLSVFCKSAFLMVVSGALLVGGYMLGYRAFHNIWVVMVASVTPILVLEPIIGYLVFRQLPTIGATVGIALGAAGFVVALIK